MAFKIMIALDDDDDEGFVTNDLITIASYLEAALRVTGHLRSITCYKDGTKIKTERRTMREITANARPDNVKGS